MYATVDDLKKRLSQVYAQLYSDPDTGLVDEDCMAEDLANANAEVDGAIAKRYSVPVTAADAIALLKGWQLTLSEELAWNRSASDAIPEKVKDRVKVVRERLKEARDGNFRLPGAPAETASGQGGAAILSVATPVFTREKMGGF